MAAATVRTRFGPDPPFASLPADFQACIRNSSSACDNLVGSELAAGGYCAQPAYAGTTYCACVNAPTAQPACFFAPCTNSANSYTPLKQQQVVDRGECPKSIICNQIVEIGGSDNVAQGITQQCGVINNITTQLAAKPIFAVIIFVLLVVLIALVVAQPSDDAGGGYPFGPVLF